MFRSDSDPCPDEGDMDITLNYLLIRVKFFYSVKSMGRVCMALLDGISR